MILELIFIIVSIIAVLVGCFAWWDLNKFENKSWKAGLIFYFISLFLAIGLYILLLIFPEWQVYFNQPW